MKRPLSLIEVMVSLSLAAILLTFLFSTFRQLKETELIVEKIEKEKSGEALFICRLNQIFESIPSHSVFRIEPYGDKIQKALHFTFDNGIDPDPAFCQVQEGYLGVTEKKALVFYTEPKQGKARKEIFFTKGKTTTISFFDPKEKSWVTTWESDSLPPLVKITLDQKEFFFTLANGNRMIHTL